MAIAQGKWVNQRNSLANAKEIEWEEHKLETCNEMSSIQSNGFDELNSFGT